MSFFFMTEYYSIVYMYHIFIHSSVDGHLGCFHVLAVVNSAAMSTGVRVSFQIIVLSGYMPRSGIAGSYGNSHFLRNLHSVLVLRLLHTRGETAALPSASVSHLSEEGLVLDLLHLSEPEHPRVLKDPVAEVALLQGSPGVQWPREPRGHLHQRIFNSAWTNGLCRP